ncbi:MAG: CHASE2 domain-containing protein [Candidatus Loosdrechtia sp.]|uniref:CHASE2 domain-containing protein n=1 Tax=Candidatus Loosdrechtia sp. TaxID=3101272 RepID=UPI003A717B56|nr:MAG: adenylate/guanylate cyclase domain-containing protein [Candidatus Jettenia sp. AMX2]
MMLHLRRAILLGLFTGLLGIMIGFFPFVSGLEEKADLDLLFRLRGPRQVPPDVVIVSIDKHSAQKLNITGDLKEWPRSLHASLIESLTNLGAGVIAFDLLFHEPATSEDDDAFARAISKTSNVILCESLRKETIPLPDKRGPPAGDIHMVKLVQPIPLFTQSALATAPFPLPKVPVRVSQYWTFKTSAGERPTFPVVAFYIFALPQYNKFIQLLEKHDPSVAGRLPSDMNEVIHSKSMIRVIEVIRDIFRKNPWIAKKMLKELEALPSISADAREKQILRSLIRINHYQDCRYLNFYGPPGTIPTISYYQVLQFADKLKIEQKPAYFSNKVVFIGSSGDLYSFQRDSFYTVFSQPDGLDLSGVEIAATAFANTLEDMPVLPLYGYSYLGTIFFWGFTVGIICYLFSTGISAAGVTGINGVYLLFALYQFEKAGVWYPLTIPLFIQSPLAFFTAIIGRYVEVSKERKNIKMAFRHYIPDDVVDQLSKNLAGLRTHNQLVYGTCLSTDAEQYTSLSETLDPKELRSFINTYYEAIFESIKRHGGLVANVIGDSALALWVMTHPDEERRVQACLSALDIQWGIRRFNQSSPFMQLPTRIGLHSGHMLLGNIGAADHYEYRPIGDIVNTATRIEGLNKYLGTRILVSEEVITNVDDFLTREIGKFLLAGKSRPLAIFELLCLKEESNQRQRDLCLWYAEALDAFKRQLWYESMEKFYKIIRIYGDDGPSVFYTKLCKKYRNKQYGESWNGVICMRKK